MLLNCNFPLYQTKRTGLNPCSVDNFLLDKLSLSETMVLTQKDVRNYLTNSTLSSRLNTEAIF